MVIERCDIAGKMAVAVIHRRSADIDVAQNDDLPMVFLKKFANAFLQHQMIVHFEGETCIRCLVRTIDVDEDEKSKVKDKSTTFGIQGVKR